MPRRLPPLNALRAFEAAARHLSFTLAAEELNVTPAAISHQVKSLEEHLGVPLFRRMTRALMLTDPGQAALPLLRDGFDKLAAATNEMRRSEASGVIHVSVPPSFGAKWLVPRLDRFRRQHPEIDVRLDATDRLVDFGRDDVDVALRYGKGAYPDLHVDLLFEEESTPICSPALLEKNPINEPGDLRNHTLLHVKWLVESESAPSWRMWLLAAGVDDIDTSRGPSFSLEIMAVQAAIEGHGVALVSSVLVGDDVAAGRLVKPLELSVAGPISFSHYVVCQEARAEHPKIKAFREWVLGEAAQTRAEEASQADT